MTEPKRVQPEVRNWEKLASGLRNFSTWLSPTGVMATDIDFLVHASNKQKGDSFLVIEFKEAGVPANVGQKILFRALQKLPGFTVVQVWGPDKEGLFVVAGDWKGKITKEDLASRVLDWWTEAKRVEEE